LTTQKNRRREKERRREGEEQHLRVNADIYNLLAVAVRRCFFSAATQGKTDRLILVV
jgi:hypothetical protein